MVTQKNLEHDMILPPKLTMSIPEGVQRTIFPDLSLAIRSAVDEKPSMEAETNAALLINYYTQRLTACEYSR